jgi:hypothetical protein
VGKNNNKWVEQAVSKRGSTLSNKHMKKCSTYFVIKQMQIKMILRFYFTPVRMAIIKKTTMLARMHRKSDQYTLTWECKLGKSVWKSAWRFLRSLRLKPSYDPASQHPIEIHNHVYNNSVHSSPNTESAQVPINQ